MLPPVRNHAVGDEFHGPELLVKSSDEGCVAKENGGAVVVVVRVGREGEDEAVDFGGRDANG
jgi:hypothetical protein